MAAHATHKDNHTNPQAKRQTIARRQARAVKTNTGSIRITRAGHAR